MSAPGDDRRIVGAFFLVMIVLGFWSYFAFSAGRIVGSARCEARWTPELSRARHEARLQGFADATEKWTADALRRRAAEENLYTVPPREITRGGAATGFAPADWQPPMRFQRALLTAVYFAEPSEVAARCGASAAGTAATACEHTVGSRKPVLVMPNPCGFHDWYALILCHEIGHGHGWPSDHRDGHFVGPTVTLAEDVWNSIVLDDELRRRLPRVLNTIIVDQAGRVPAEGGAGS